MTHLGNFLTHTAGSVEQQEHDAYMEGQANTTFKWGDYNPMSASGMGFTGDDLSSLPVGLPGTLDTFEGSPAALWQSARMARMGASAAIPQFQRTAMQGFTPALGGYYLAGGRVGDADTSTFADYLGARSNQNIGTDWSRAVQASKMLDPAYTPPADTGMTGEQLLALQGAMSGENARRNAIAMAQRGIGGTGRGLIGQTQRRALGNLYDLYASRAASVGSPTGGFLGYLGDIT